MYYFRGFSKSHIYYDATTSKWILQSFVNPNISITTKSKWPYDIPLGTVQWQVTTDSGLCQLPKDSVAELTLSICYPDKYTCNSGHCIHLNDKCDALIDCEDKSDESNCEPVIIGANYVKEMAPIPKSRDPCLVYINISVLSIPHIETVNLQFTADFYLNLRWYDLRLDFTDLKNITYVNKLGLPDLEAIWTPRLVFLNALGPYQTVIDDLSSGLVSCEGMSLPEDISLSTEGKCPKT